MGDDGVDRDMETVCYLLVEHAFGDADQNLFLAGGQFLAVLGPGIAGILGQRVTELADDCRGVSYMLMVSS